MMGTNQRQEYEAGDLWVVKIEDKQIELKTQGLCSAQGDHRDVFAWVQARDDTTSCGNL